MRANFLVILSLLGCTFTTAQQPNSTIAGATPSSQNGTSPTEEPRVFITDSQSWEMSGAAGGTNGSYAAYSSGGARPQTAEIIKTFGQRCPNVTVNNKLEIADYIVVLDHEGGKGLLRHKDKVAVFERASGDVVISHSTLSVGGSVDEACKGIGGHWAAHGADILAAKKKYSSPQLPQGSPNVAQSPSQAAAQATVTIESTPLGADISIDGAFVGSTPSSINLPIGTHEISIAKKGFADWAKKLNVSGGTIRLNVELDPAKPL
jgi:hypothetical protein